MLTTMFSPDMRKSKQTNKQTNKKQNNDFNAVYIHLQMLGMRKSLLFTLAVALTTVSFSKQDCASCCHGKWIACFTGCETMKDCDSQCNTGLEICQNGCPGSCSVDDPPSFRKRNLVSGTRSNNRPRNLKMKKKLNKLLKKLQRKSGS